MEKILVVDDEPAMRLALREALRRKGYEVLEADGGRSALETLGKDPGVKLILSDVRMPEMSGPELLEAVKAQYPSLPFIIMTAFGTIEDAVEAMRLGACDYVLKPFTGDLIEAAIVKALTAARSGDPDADMEEVETVAGDACDVTGLNRIGRAIHGSGRLVFNDPSVGAIIAMIDEISDSQATLLIEGESGTGKEVLARYLHQRSPRRDKPFVAVNCAALPEGLLESELFGHEKGSFTGAIQSRKGKFELAEGGTILLDEISEMPLSLQAKMLRVLQEHEIDPVGGRSPVSVNIRVVATTNRDLASAVSNGTFREDLFYRLNVIRVRIPPLRERTGDIIPLAEYFLQKHCRRNHRPTKRLGAAMLEYLFSQRWAGNVRELENFIERAVLLCKDEEITPGRLFLSNAPECAAPAPAPRPSAISAPYGYTLKAVTNEGDALPESEREPKPGLFPNAEPPETTRRFEFEAAHSAPYSNSASAPVFSGGFLTLEEMERRLILGTLEKVGGNRTRAAELLGVSVRTIRNKLAQYRDPSLAAQAGG